MKRTKLVIPKDGEKITANADLSLNVPNHPIITYIEGDGTGVDITPVMLKVVNAAVDKAYGARRSIAWMEIYAGEKATRVYGPNEWLPAETLEAFREYLVGIKGPLTTPVGGGIRSLNVALRQELDLYVCLRPVRWFKGVPSAGDRTAEDRHGDLPRELRGHLRRHRVGPSRPRRRSSSSSCVEGDGRQEDPLPGARRASASSRCRARAPSGSCARRSSTRSTTTSRRSRWCTRATS
jgi:hypothetical protein